MPRLAKKQFKAWSFSRKGDYDKCAMMACLKHLHKIPSFRPDPPKGKESPLDRGSRIHGLADVFITASRAKKLPDELELFAEEFAHLRKIRKRVNVEIQFAVDAAWQECDWFSRTAWCRGKIDAEYENGDTLVLIDYKTGRFKHELEQLELYAAVRSVMAPAHIKKFRCEFWFLDEGRINGATYTRAQAKKFQARFTKETRKMLADTTFKATPSDNACRWCDYRKKDGGPCKY